MDKKNRQIIELITNQMSWTALITILILKALKTQAKHLWYLSNLVTFIRLNLFVKVELNSWLDNPFQNEQPSSNKYMQRILF